ncbi:hypothetical protein FB561_6338 [Kribbella amoyensis]|uniref:Uncharacterized protein n=1 Tax=Kribbella amoyensis TaxID=996641 RepID=A0A561B7T5_9ACTN|nr:hypothetical protein [Kribbella amoyensis]TWD74903.1 hypothetical protein FB561_6338 [Kribbella amoyensis]
MADQDPQAEQPPDPGPADPPGGTEKDGIVIPGRFQIKLVGGLQSRRSAKRNRSTGADEESGEKAGGDRTGDA